MSSGFEPIVMRSADGVEMELPIASPAPRMLAYAVDVILVYLLMVFVMAVILMMIPAAGWLEASLQGWLDELLPTLTDPEGSDFPVALALMMAVFQFLMAFHEFLYFSAWELLSRGRTPGKYLAGLRVVDNNGQPTGGTPILIRNALRLVDSLPMGYLVGLVAMILSPRAQRLGDRAAGTTVIRTDKLPQVDEIDLPPGLSPMALSRAQLSLLGQREVRLIRSTLRRVNGLPADQAHGLLTGAAEALGARLQLSQEESQDPERLLQRLLLTATRRVD